jgi:hypothetical protein
MLAATAHALRISRAAAQLLHRPKAASAGELVRRLLAVQAQDLRAARLALRARTQRLTASAVDAALDDRELVVAWLNRGTLHLVAPDDYLWLLALTAPTRSANSRRRLGQEGVSPDEADRAVEIIERALADEGPLTRAQLAERIAAAGIRTEGQATPHLLGLAALRGIAVLGPVRGDQQAFALARDWLSVAPLPLTGAGRAAAPARLPGAARGAAPAPLTGPDRDAALAELARRYLAAHGPATAADLAAWSGLPLRDARAGLTAIASELVELPYQLIDLAARDAAPDAIEPRLLPAFDPYLLGWKDRSFAVPRKHAKRVHPGGGILRATATVEGLAVGTWTAPAGHVKLDLFTDVDDVAATTLQAEADDIARFLTC